MIVIDCRIEDIMINFYISTIITIVTISVYYGLFLLLSDGADLCVFDRIALSKI
jgi:hypothetical protein